MHRPSGRIPRIVAAALLLASAAACTERRTAERADSDLSRDLALASRIDAQPALQDTAVAPSAAQSQPLAKAPAPQPERRAAERPQATPAPAPVTPQSTPVAPPAVSRPTLDSAAAAAPQMPAPAPVRMIPAGTGLPLSSGMKVCTSTNKVGDKLVATVTSAVEGENGAVIPAGSRVVLEVARVTPGDATDSSQIAFRPTVLYISGNSYGVSGAVVATTRTERVEAPSTGVSDKTKVVGGAVAGAILGQILGRDTKSTIIGAAAGAATGAAVAHAQKSYQACLPEGASLVLTLASPVTMQ